ncbi:6755_t:CDS:1, partial [Diversispora eburnea]
NITKTSEREYYMGFPCCAREISYLQPGNHCWNFELALPGKLIETIEEMSIQKSRCLADSENNQIRIEHKVRFDVTFQNEDKDYYEVTASLTVIITSCPSRITNQHS